MIVFGATLLTMRGKQCFCFLLIFVSVVSAAVAQQISAPAPQTGTIIGTVIDVNEHTVSSASVVLEGSSPSERRTVVTNSTGFFQFHDLNPGTRYQITVRAKGFADWVSPAIILQPGQYLDLTRVRLRIATVITTVNAGYATEPLEPLATEQVKAEEKQRILGIIPNFYVLYDRNAVPLTARLKFSLALKTATDPSSFIGAGILAGIYQAAHTPGYVEGWKGYGQRFGAVYAGAYAGGFTDIMIGGAILPSLLHQDPRFFYQGTGTKRSRILHAVLSAFVTRGDNGRQQPNYSALGGDLASAAISNTYYPAANRGAGQVFENALINTSERVIANQGQEFILGKLTSKAKKQY